MNTRFGLRTRRTVGHRVLGVSMVLAICAAGLGCHSCPKSHARDVVADDLRDADIVRMAESINATARKLDIPAAHLHAVAIPAERTIILRGRSSDLRRVQEFLMESISEVSTERTSGQR